MKKQNPLQQKSYQFSLSIINLYKNYWVKNYSMVLFRQVLRSATSIGANVEEGLSGVSKKEFVFKLQISLKESFETRYWLNLLRDSQAIPGEIANRLINQCEELIRILTSIIKTTKRNLNSSH